MSGRPNHRGWIVLDSLHSFDGRWCVDLFELPSGGYGFEHFRAEPEDGGRWTPVDGFAATVFGDVQSALDAAVANVEWLDGDRADVGAARQRLGREA